MSHHILDQDDARLSKKAVLIIIGAVIAGIVGIWAFFSSYIVVDAGYVKVATVFGKPQDTVYKEGFHFINPAADMHTYDTRDKSELFKNVSVQTQDQLTSFMDVRVQYHIIPSKAVDILRSVGTEEQLIDVKLKAQMYSILREFTRSIGKTELLFKDNIQNELQEKIYHKLSEKLRPMGIDVTGVLISHVELPRFIKQAIEAKVQREQQVETQRAELERKDIEAQEQVVVSKANLAAQENNAKAERIKADTEAYKIKIQAEALKLTPPTYVQLQAIDALKSMSKDPSAKFYFLNGDSPQPFPLLNLGEVSAKPSK